MIPWFSFLTSLLAFFAILAGGLFQEARAEEKWGSPKILEPRLNYEDELRQALETFRQDQGGLNEANLFPLIRSWEVKFSLLEIATLILNSFPPERYDYMSLGRSGAALSVAMEVLLEVRGSDAKVLEFPLSGLRQDHFLPSSCLYGYLKNGQGRGVDSRAQAGASSGAFRSSGR